MHKSINFLLSIQFTLSTLFALFTFPLFARDTFFYINKDHSQIFFEVAFLKVSKISGQFNSFTGKVIFDEENHPKSISIKISCDSIFTNLKRRDGHLKAIDFFYCNQHPYIHFTSSKIEHIKDINHNYNYKVLGNLEIKKSKQPITINFKLTESVNDTWQYPNKFAHFSFTLSRSQFGLEWNKSLAKDQLMVADNVKVWGSFQIQELNKQTPTGKYMIPDTKIIRYREKVLRGEREARIDPTLPKISEFNKNEIENTNKKTKIIIPNKKIDTTNVANINKTSKTFLWWLCWFIIGFYGFISTWILTTKLKIIFDKKNSPELISDLIGIAVASLYAYCLFILATQS